MRLRIVSENMLKNDLKVAPFLPGKQVRSDDSFARSEHSGY